MKQFPLLLLLGLLASSSASVAAVATPHPAAWQMSAAEAEFNNIGSSAMALVQRALSLPNDADAVALLQKEGAALRQRAQKLRPVYTKWLSGLNARAAAGVRERIQSSSFGGYFGSLETDPQMSVRLRSNPALNKAVDNVTSALAMR